MTRKDLFDKRFVHFMWEDELEGKEGNVADSIDVLEVCVEEGYQICTVTESSDLSYPFMVNDRDSSYRFFYYDPNYACKLALIAGKQIQRFNYEEEWIDDNNPKWYVDMEYRIKPESSRMTYRQLSEWLAKGNGECKFCETITSRVVYSKYDENKDVSTEYKIRRWKSDEWIESTVEVYKADCK